MTDLLSMLATTLYEEEYMIYRDSYAYVYLDNIDHNIKQMKNIISDKTKIAIVVKADAYGHGIKEVVDISVLNGVDCIAVATLIEGLLVRKYNKNIDILIMGNTPSQYALKAIDNRLILTIFSDDSYKQLIGILQGKNIKPKVHIKIDTGFNRLGFRIDDNAFEMLQKIYSDNILEIQGIYTHLALKDRQKDKEQYDLFNSFLKKLNQNNINIPVAHICDSIGAVSYPAYHMDMVRLGAIIYGLKSLRKEYESLDLRMALKLVSKISHIKTIKKGDGISYDHSYVAQTNRIIAILPIGYADGVPRELSNKGYVSINGSKAPIVGKICMDQMMVDISNVPNVKLRDETIIYYDGSENSMSIDQVAIMCNTNKNEIISRISPRVPRIYIKNDKIVEEKIPILEGLYDY
ncbi:MAG: alanine racemase [Clostridium sp.]|jgi:alanine racemase